MRLHIVFVLILFSASSQLNAARFIPLIYQDTPVRWNRDEDRNRIEDYLDEVIAAKGRSDEVRVNINVVLSQDSKNDTLIAKFSDYGEITYLGRFLPIVTLRNVSVADLNRLSRIGDVAMIENNWPIAFCLDTSVAAIQVRHSSHFPHSVEADFSTITGAGVGIAIMDSGVRNRNKANTQGHMFLPHRKFTAGYDTETHTETDPSDPVGHGTIVASIALGVGDSSGDYRGVAPGAQLIDVKLKTNDHNQLLTSDAIEAIDKCIAKREEWNIRVINMSFVQIDEFTGDALNDNGNSSLAQYCNLAVNHGLVIVAAAGNDNKVIIPAPASADDVIAVGNLDNYYTIQRTDDRLGTLTNHGPRLSDGDGLTLDEQKPLVVAPGTAIMGAGNTTHWDLTQKHGTSLSAPHVSGVAALIIQKCPEINPLSVYHAILMSAEPSTTVTWDPSCGYGTINGYRALQYVGSCNSIGSSTANNSLSYQDVGFSSEGNHSWISPDLTTARPLQVGQPNKVRCNIKNFGTVDAENVLVRFGVYDFGNGSAQHYHVIAQRRIDVPSGHSTDVSVGWTPTRSTNGNLLACLVAEIGYGADQNFSNNRARRNLLISQLSPPASDNKVLLTLENQSGKEADLSVDSFLVDHKNKFIRIHKSNLLHTDFQTITVGAQDPSITIPIGLKESKNEVHKESARHLDIVIKSTHTDTTHEQGGVRIIQSSPGGTPPSITVEGRRILLTDNHSGISHVDISSISGGSAEIASFVPGEKQVAVEIHPEGVDDVSCSVTVWDCALNCSTRNVVIPSSK